MLIWKLNWILKFLRCHFLSHYPKYILKGILFTSPLSKIAAMKRGLKFTSQAFLFLRDGMWWKKQADINWCFSISSCSVQAFASFWLQKMTCSQNAKDSIPFRWGNMPMGIRVCQIILSFMINNEVFHFSYAIKHHIRLKNVPCTK